MMVVLNHIDVVPEDRREAMLDDLRKVLAADGLGDIPVIATSARFGEGIADLKAAIAGRVRDKGAKLDRIGTDVTAAAEAMREAGGTGRARARQDGQGSIGGCVCRRCGVPTVVSAVRKSSEQRARQATGWPLTKWLGRLRRDPLKRLHLDLDEEGRKLTAIARTSLPEATPVQRARVDMAVREAADKVSADLTPAWSDSIRRASVSQIGDLGDALDKAIAHTDLGVSRTPVLWRLTQVLQALLFVAAVAGGLWLLGLAVLDYLQVDVPAAPKVAGMALPTLLLLAGAGAGIALSLIFRGLGGLSAKSRARTANRRLRAAITEVAEDLVLAPIEAEVEQYDRSRSGLNAALSR